MELVCSCGLVSCRMTPMRPLFKLAVLVAVFAAWLFKAPPWSTNTPDRFQCGADVTAVLLNWARLPNVVQITTSLCGIDVIEQILVWNNNYSRPLVYDVCSLFVHEGTADILHAF
jgi:hypothetical protein